MISGGCLRSRRSRVAIAFAVLLASVAGPAPAAQGCVGDCSGDGVVNVDEITTLIAIAIGERPATDCFDPNRDGSITVEEILGAVGNSLNACPHNSLRYLYPGPQLMAGPPATIADVNGDNAPDIVQAPAVLLNNRDGSFSLHDLPDDAASGPVSTAPMTAVGDFDGDGIDDLATGGTDDAGTIEIVLGGHGCGGSCSRFAIGEPVHTLLAADFTADGHVDLGVIGASSSGTSRSDRLTIVEGNGDGTFLTNRRVFAEKSSTFRIADFNNDHLVDVLRLSFDPNGFTAYLRTEDGRFEEAGFAPLLPFPPPETSLSTPDPLAIGDFDGDGVVDFAMVRLEGSVHVYWGNGDGTFTAAEIVAVGTQPRAVMAYDLNADRRDDLLTANYGSDDVTVLQSPGGRRFDLRSITAGDGPTRLAVADFDGDGRVDLVTTNSISKDISIRLAGATNDFANERRIRTERIESVITSDLNGDAFADLVLNDAFSFATLIGAGDGTFRSPRGYPALNPFNEMRAADVNVDGHVDLLVPDVSSTIGLWLGDGRGELVGPYNFSSGSVVDDFNVGDVNGDGVPDLLMSGVKVTAPVLVGGLVEMRGYPCTEPEASYSVGYPRQLAGNASAFAVADLNGDQRLDLITGGTDSAVILTEPSGELGLRRELPDSGQTAAVVAGDLNSDGAVDVVSANTSSSSVSIYENDGDGAFTSRTSIPVASAPEALMLSDVNGDGLSDIVVGHRGGLTVHLGSPTGSYENAGTIPLELGIRIRSFGSPPMLAADFDRNGTLDLAASLNSGIGIFSGKGDGQFSEIGTIADFPTTANGMVAGDLDEDGIIDIAATRAGSSDVHILRGVGDGTFVVGSRVLAGRHPQGIDVADVDSDGHLDLITADFDGEEIVVLLGRGDGHFRIRRFAGWISAQSLVIRDFDGDGDADVLTAEGTQISIHPGMFLRCALPHDPRSIQAVTRCSITADGEAQVLSCF